MGDIISDDGSEGYWDPDYLADLLARGERILAFCKKRDELVDSLDRCIANHAELMEIAGGLGEDTVLPAEEDIVSSLVFSDGDLNFAACAERIEKTEEEVSAALLEMQDAMAKFEQKLTKILDECPPWLRNLSKEELQQTIRDLLQELQLENAELVGEEHKTQFAYQEAILWSERMTVALKEAHAFKAEADNKYQSSCVAHNQAQEKLSIAILNHQEAIAKEKGATAAKEIAKARAENSDEEQHKAREELEQAIISHQNSLIAVQEALDIKTKVERECQEAAIVQSNAEGSYKNAIINQIEQEAKLEEAQKHLKQAIAVFEAAYRSYLLAVEETIQAQGRWVKAAKKQGLTRGIMSLVAVVAAAATAGAIAPYLLPTIFQATAVTGALGGAISGTLTVGQFATILLEGFIGGATGAAINKRDILKGGLQGLAFAGVGAKVSHSIGSIKEVQQLVSNSKHAMQAIQVAGSTMATTALSVTIDGGGHVLKRMLVDSIAAGVGQRLLPIPEGGHVAKNIQVVAGATRSLVTDGIKVFICNTPDVREQLLLAAISGGVREGARLLGERVGDDLGYLLRPPQAASTVAVLAVKNPRVEEMPGVLVPTTAQQIRIAEHQVVDRVGRNRQQRAPKYAELKMVVAQTAAGNTLVLSEGEFKQALRFVPKGSKFDWLGLVGLGSAQAVDDTSLAIYQNREASTTEVRSGNYLGQFSGSLAFSSTAELQQQ